MPYSRGSKKKNGKTSRDEDSGGNDGRYRKKEPSSPSVAGGLAGWSGAGKVVWARGASAEELERTGALALARRAGGIG